MDEIRQIVFRDYERGFSALVSSSTAIESEKDELMDHLLELMDGYSVAPSDALLDGVEEAVSRSLKLGLITTEDENRVSTIIKDLRDRG